MILATAALMRVPALVTTSIVLGIDARHGEIVDLVRQIEVDDALVVPGERLFEGRLLGERRLGIEDDELRLRLLGLEEMRNHARALIRPGRAAVGVRRHRHDDDAAVRHGLELAHEELRLRAGLPGVRHDLGGFRRIALDGAVAQVDAGRQHEAVAGQRRAAGERDRLLRRVDADGAVVGDRDAEAAQPVVGVLQGGERAEAAEVMIGVKAARVDRLRLDERHVELRRLRLQDARDRGAARPAPDDDDLGLCLGDRCPADETRARRRDPPAADKPSEGPAIDHGRDALFPARHCRYRYRDRANPATEQNAEYENRMAENAEVLLVDRRDFVVGARCRGARRRVARRRPGCRAGERAQRRVRGGTAGGARRGDARRRRHRDGSPRGGRERRLCAARARRREPDDRREPREGHPPAIDRQPARGRRHLPLHAAVGEGARDEPHAAGQDPGRRRHSRAERRHVPDGRPARST